MLVSSEMKLRGDVPAHAGMDECECPLAKHATSCPCFSRAGSNGKAIIERFFSLSLHTQGSMKVSCRVPQFVHLVPAICRGISLGGACLRRFYWKSLRMQGLKDGRLLQRLCVVFCPCVGRV